MALVWAATLSRAGSQNGHTVNVFTRPLSILEHFAELEMDELTWNVLALALLLERRKRWEAIEEEWKTLHELSELERMHSLPDNRN